MIETHSKCTEPVAIKKWREWTDFKEGVKIVATNNVFKNNILRQQHLLAEKWSLRNKIENFTFHFLFFLSHHFTSTKFVQKCGKYKQTYNLDVQPPWIRDSFYFPPHATVQFDSCHERERERRHFMAPEWHCLMSLSILRLMYSLEIFSLSMKSVWWLLRCLSHGRHHQMKANEGKVNRTEGTKRKRESGKILEPCNLVQKFPLLCLSSFPFHVTLQQFPTLCSLHFVSYAYHKLRDEIWGRERERLEWRVFTPIKEVVLEQRERE